MFVPIISGNGRCEEDGSRRPLAWPKHGRGLCWDKGKNKINQGSQWLCKQLSSILSQYANQSSLNIKHTISWCHSSTFTSKFSISQIDTMHKPAGASIHLLVCHINDKGIPSTMPCSIPASDPLREWQDTTKCDGVYLKFSPWNLPTDTRQG